MRNLQNQLNHLADIERKMNKLSQERQNVCRVISNTVRVYPQQVENLPANYRDYLERVLSQS